MLYWILINISGQFDCENNMPFIDQPANAWSSITEIIRSIDANPLTENYLQFETVAYRNIGGRNWDSNRYGGCFLASKTEIHRVYVEAYSY